MGTKRTLGQRVTPLGKDELGDCCAVFHFVSRSTLRTFRAHAASEWRTEVAAAA
jgi:hypothetical protein